MPEEYRMPVDRNIFYAKSNLAELVWREAIVEGIDCTYYAVKEICEGWAGSFPKMRVKDVIVIANLKRAWDFVFETIDVPIDLSYVRQLNSIVCTGLMPEAGELRRVEVSIGGTSWKPVLPDCDVVKAEIPKIVERACDVDGALELFCYLTRGQLFLDGNKRTAQLVVNKLLIANGCGIFMIPGYVKDEFSELLTGFYETGKREELCSFLAKFSIEVFCVESDKVDPAHLIKKYGNTYAKACYSFPPFSDELLIHYPSYKWSYQKGIACAVGEHQDGYVSGSRIVQFADSYARNYLIGENSAASLLKNMLKVAKDFGLSEKEAAEEALEAMTDSVKKVALKEKYGVEPDPVDSSLKPVDDWRRLFCITGVGEDLSVFLCGQKEDSETAKHLEKQRKKQLEEQLEERKKQLDKKLAEVKKKAVGLKEELKQLDEG